MRPIQVMIAGAQKAGTSSLKDYLARHPAVCTHDRSEIAFFIHDPEYRLGYARIFPRYFGRCSNRECLILAKNAAILYIPEAARRLWDHNPEVHLIVLLRNPVDRAYSAYWYARRRGWESLGTFEEALAAESERLKEDRLKWRQCAYLDRGRYYDQLVNLWQQFGESQVRVFLLEDLKEDAVGLCRNLFSHFGLDDGVTQVTHRRANQAATVRSNMLARVLTSTNVVKRGFSSLLPSGLKYGIRAQIKRLNEKDFTPPPMNPDTRVRLQVHFEPCNRRLSAALGRDLHRWSL